MGGLSATGCGHSSVERVQPDEGHDAGRFRGAVFHVVADGRAGVAQRRADLVPPAAVRQGDLEERPSSGLGHDVVARRGELVSRRDFEGRPVPRLLIEHGERPARRRLRGAAGRRPHRVDEDGAGALGHAVDDGEVALLDAAVGERFVKRVAALLEAATSMQPDTGRSSRCAGFA